MIINERIVEYFSNPRNLEEMSEPDLVIIEGHPVCGDTVHLYVKMENDSTIRKASFQTYGCATSVALSSMLVEKFGGLTAEEVQNISRENIMEMLGRISPDQTHCIDIGVNLIQKFSDEYNKKYGNR